jgi:glucokinase
LKKFSPTNENEWEYEEYLMKEMPDLEEKYGYLPLDKAFCGDAITHMYKYFCQKENQKPQTLFSGEILFKGMNKKDTICEKTVEFFLRVLGVEVSNFALETLPTNGIYLVGGYLSILMKMLK